MPGPESSYDATMSTMQFPTPDDPKRAPVWENYVVAQAAHAALGLIPAHAHAVGVAVHGTVVTLILQSSPGTALENDEDIVEIVSGLEVNLGPAVRVYAQVDETHAPRLDPRDGVRWFFASKG